jgi:hypothetical protein
MKNPRTLTVDEFLISYLKGQPETWTIPTTLFDNTYVSFTAVMDSDNAALPSWLEFDSSSRSFTIYPRERNLENAVIKLTGKTASDVSMTKIIEIVTRNVHNVLALYKAETIIKKKWLPTEWNN